MTAVVCLMIQSLPLSLSLGTVILILLGLLLLAMVGGGLLALRLFAKTEQAQEFPSLTESRPGVVEVLNALPFPAVLVGLDEQPLATNPEAASWLEAQSPPRLATPLRTLVRRVVAKREVETVQVTLDKETPPLKVQASPLFGSGHHSEGYHSGESATDVLRGVLLLALPGGMGAGSDLTRLVAHELRTPLTAIVGHAEILESCSPADEALWHRSRDFIAAETQRLARLVDDLLALSRLEASPPLMRTINLRSVVESALSRLFDSAEAAGLALTLDAPSNLPRIRVDSDRLEQALVNLLNNAIKYTPAGGTVTARLTSEGGYVRVEIRDSGPGIPPEDLPHLFEPLYRAESVRHLPGTGLGLTIVRTILDQHDAPISVHSTSDPSAPDSSGGTTFTFRLPIVR